MTSTVLPLTVRTSGHDLDLLLDLPSPTPWASIRPAVLVCCDLPVGTVLHLGVGPVQDSWLLGVAPLLAGVLLSTEPRETEALAITGSVNLSCVAGPDAGRWVGMGDESVTVGRHPDCDLGIDDPYLSRWHARIEAGPGGLLIQDLRSANGTRVDGGLGAQAEETGSGTVITVPAQGLIRLGASVLRAGLDTEPRLLLTPDGAGRLAVARPARVAPAFGLPMPPAVGPPPQRSRRPLPILAAAIGAVAGAGIAAVTGLWSFLLLAALGPVMMITTALSDRLAGRRSHRREVVDHRRALADQSSVQDAAAAADRADAWDRYPDPATLARRARFASSRLWERRPDDADFLRLALGVGRRPARVASEHAPTVPDVPITVDLAQIGVLGLAGDCRPVLRHWIAQMAALHSPADLQLSIFSVHSDLAPLVDLPHTSVRGRTGVLHRESAAPEVARLLRTSGDGPITVLVLDDADRWRRMSGMKDLLDRAARPATAAAGLREPVGSNPTGPSVSRPADRRLVAICVATSVQALPVECNAVAVVRSGAVEFAAGAVTGRAEATGVCAAYLDEMARALAPLLDPDAPGAGLPAAVTLGQLHGGDLPAAMGAGWAQPGLVATVGVGAAGLVTIDLERDGPHLLIAGTTGSGKSELLRTLIAGLVLSAPPDRTTFMLVDYKGGAAFGRLGDLPHTVGLVTDLDATLAVRALSGLHAEVRRRERLLAEHGVQDVAALRRTARAHAPPALVIVVDEFATLGAELPEFLAGLLDIAQRGRSLGLHLVLATQRPAGVLSPAMKANVGLRICLRVTDDADSMDVIGSPEAAVLGVGDIGRALLRSERSRTTPFQVATVSTCIGGTPTVRLREGIVPALPPEPEGPTDLDVVVATARAKAGGQPVPHRPWTPPLPAEYAPADPEVLGLLDEPWEQRQTDLRTPHGSLMLLGPPGSGRSCGLRRFAWCAARRGSCLLVVDAGGSLADLAHWPSTRTYLTGDDPWLVQRLVRRLQESLGPMPAGAATEGQMVLVVDGWEAIIGALDVLDFGASTADLVDLAARGPAGGLQLGISGDLRSQHHRGAAAFTSIVRLGADERGDVRRSPPGRGYLGSTQVQLAHAPPGCSPPDLPGLPHHVRGPVIRPLPSRIGLTALPRRPVGSAAAPTPAAVPIGVGGDDGAVQFLDLDGPGGGFLVAGPRRSGVSTTLLVLATGALEAGVPVVRAHFGPLAPLAGAQDIDLRRGPEELHRLLAGHEGAILLVADDCGSGAGAVEDGAVGSVSTLLERFVTVAGRGQYLALGTRLDRAVRALRGPVAEVSALRCGVLLHADCADGPLLDTVLPRRRGPVLPGRGHLVREGLAIPVQVAQP